MKRRLAAALAAALASTLLAAAPPAQAQTWGCVTAYELYVAKKGMTKAQVHRIFDTSGRVEWTSVGMFGYDETRTYRKCRGFDGGSDRVLVGYDDYTYSYGNELRMWSKWRWACGNAGYC